MKTGIATGPLLLLLWQVAPYGSSRDSTGRVRLSLGYGSGQYESRQVDCNGDVRFSRPVPYHTTGAEVDVWATPRVRLSLYGGSLSSRGGDENPLRRFGGALLSYEGQHFGIGGGPARFSGSEGG